LSPSPPQSSSRRSAKIAVVLAVVTVLGAAKWLGVFEQVEEPAQLAKSLIDLGAWGYLAFVLAYALLQPFGVPGTIFVFAAPLIWPWPVAFALSMTGTMAASVIGFNFSRFIARDWIARRVPARFQKYDAALGRRAFATVFTLRFVFWMPQLLHAFFGVSQVRGWTHFWGSLAGYAIPLLLVSFFGQAFFDWIKNAPPSTWLAVGGTVVVIALAFWLLRRCQSQSAGSEAT
jgi:uncharacterized membrane protein YdjX (TVP38/TMEM64 family)